MPLALLARGLAVLAVTVHIGFSSGGFFGLLRGLPRLAGSVDHRHVIGGYAQAVPLAQTAGVRSHCRRPPRKGYDRKSKAPSGGSRGLWCTVSFSHTNLYPKALFIRVLYAVVALLASTTAAEPSSSRTIRFRLKVWITSRRNKFPHGAA